MSERDIGQEILDGIEEVKAFKYGKVQLKTSTLPEPSPAKEIREKLGINPNVGGSTCHR